MVQHLRKSRAVLVEDMSSGQASVHAVAHNHLTPVQRIQGPLQSSQAAGRHSHTCAHARACTHTHAGKTFTKSKPPPPKKKHFIRGKTV